MMSRLRSPASGARPDAGADWLHRLVRRFEGSWQWLATRYRFALMLLIPTLTELLESGGFPATARQWITDVVMTAMVAGLLWQLHRVHRALLEVSETDALTRLWNRRKFDADLDREVGRAHRQGHALVLAYVDVDRFKSVNDRFGHEEGDRVLLRVAALLANGVREHVDACYRIGGDEFAVLAPVKDAAGASRIRERLRGIALEGTKCLGEYGSGLSIGLADLQRDMTPASLRARADALMYQQKNTGAEAR